MLFEYIVALLVAALAGGLIGIEREYRDKSAGFRTMILISVGSALFTIMSVIIGIEDGESSRITAAIVTGVGFLGAGVIFKGGPTVHGLTTAASIWIVSSLGMAAGAGEYELVLAVTAISLIVLWLLPPFEHWLDKLYEFSEFHVTVKNSDQAEAKIISLLKDHKVKVIQVDRSKIATGERVLKIKIKTTLGNQNEVNTALVSEKSVIAFNS